MKRQKFTKYQDFFNFPIKNFLYYLQIQKKLLPLHQKNNSKLKTKRIRTMKALSSVLSIFAAVASAMALTACSASDDFSNENEVQSPKVVSYTPAKASKIQITSGNNVLGVTGVTSRGADVNGNMWDFMPEYPTQEEIAGVLAYIASKPAGVQWPGYTEYYIQHVGGAHHTYYYSDNNQASHEMDGTQSMEQLTVIEADGTVQHVNNFNQGKCDNAATHNSTHMTNGFQGAFALNEYSSSVVPAWRLFYWNGNYYLGLDYNMHKGDGSIDADGVYDDWIVKIIPGSNETVVVPQDDPEQTSPAKAMVEVNLALNEQKATDDYIASKLSIHVRDTSDVEIFIPVPAEYYCEADDMFIVKNHGVDVNGNANYVYNSSVETLTMDIAGQTVTLTCTFDDAGITVKTQGINATVLEYLREEYGDGINFEIWNYYNREKEDKTLINRDEIQGYLNQSTIKFTNPVEEYINTINNNEEYDLDCIVTRQ